MSTIFLFYFHPLTNFKEIKLKTSFMDNPLPAGHRFKSGNGGGEGGGSKVESEKNSFNAARSAFDTPR